MTKVDLTFASPQQDGFGNADKKKAWDCSLILRERLW